MRFFNLIIADDEVTKRTEGFRNLSSMLYAFVTAFAVTLVSGLWHLFVPLDVNWNASQIVLVLHIAGGVMSLILLAAFFVLHQRALEQPLWMLLAPWKLEQETDEESRHFNQRCVGHVVTWILLTVYGTGLLISLPGLLFALGTVWMQGYAASQLLGDFHAWATLALIPLLLVHMLWIARSRR